jgi:DNA end-binding protein Ku
MRSPRASNTFTRSGRVPERAKRKKNGVPGPDIEDAPSNRPFWSGVVTFGLVSIPVDLYPAIRTGGAPLRLLDADGTPLQRRYYCPEDGEDVPSEEIVRGYELDDGRYVTVTDEELEALDPKKSREIDLRLFVARDEIDPIYFVHGYFLAPREDSGKAYRLLAGVMERTDRAGIATFVMREKEYVVAILAEGGLLRAETLRFHDEVRSMERAGIAKARKPAAALVKKFESAVEKLATPRLPRDELVDEHADRVKALAEKKERKHEDVVRTETPSVSPGADVIDLMEVLKRSLGETKSPKHSARAKAAAKPRAQRGRRKAG